MTRESELSRLTNASGLDWINQADVEYICMFYKIYCFIHCLAVKYFIYYRTQSTILPILIVQVQAKVSGD